MKNLKRRLAIVLSVAISGMGCVSANLKSEVKKDESDQLNNAKKIIEVTKEQVKELKSNIKSSADESNGVKKECSKVVDAVEEHARSGKINTESSVVSNDGKKEADEIVNSTKKIENEISKNLVNNSAVVYENSNTTVSKIADNAKNLSALVANRVLIKPQEITKVYCGDKKNLSVNNSNVLGKVGRGIGYTFGTLTVTALGALIAKSIEINVTAYRKLNDDGSLYILPVITQNGGGLNHTNKNCTSISGLAKKIRDSLSKFNKKIDQNFGIVKSDIENVGYNFTLREVYETAVRNYGDKFHNDERGYLLKEILGIIDKSRLDDLSKKIVSGIWEYMVINYIKDETLKKWHYEQTGKNAF